MKKLTFEEACELPNGEKFYVHDESRHTFLPYIKIGNHRIIRNTMMRSVVAIKDSSYNEAVVFTHKANFYSGYDSQEVGVLLIDGLDREIKSLKDTYLK